MQMRNATVLLDENVNVRFGWMLETVHCGDLRRNLPLPNTLNQESPRYGQISESEARRDQSSFSSSSAFKLVLRFSAAWTASRSSASASPSASGSPSASAEDSSDPRREFDCDCEWLGDGRCLMSGGAARNGARSMRSNKDDIDEPNAASMDLTGTHRSSSPICASASMGLVVISLQRGDGGWGRWLALRIACARGVRRGRHER